MLICKYRERTHFVENLIPLVFLVSGLPEDCLYFADTELRNAQEENDIALRYYNAVHNRLRMTRTERNRFAQEVEQQNCTRHTRDNAAPETPAQGRLMHRQSPSQ